MKFNPFPSTIWEHIFWRCTPSGCCSSSSPPEGTAGQNMLREKSDGWITKVTQVYNRLLAVCPFECICTNIHDTHRGGCFPCTNMKTFVQKALQVLAGISTPKLHLQQPAASTYRFGQTNAAQILTYSLLQKKTKNLWPPPEGSGRTQHNKPPLTASASEPAWWLNEYTP